jgi:hypothetical protein
MLWRDRQMQITWHLPPIAYLVANSKIKLELRGRKFRIILEGVQSLNFCYFDV